MANRGDREIIFIGQIALFIATAICFLSNIYIVFYLCLNAISLRIYLIDKLILFLAEKNIFNITKISNSIALDALSCLGIFLVGICLNSSFRRYKVGIIINKNDILFLVIGICLILIKHLFPYLEYTFLSFILGINNVIGYTLFTISAIKCAMVITYRRIEDRFHAEDQTFRQEEKLIQTPYSINLPMEYYYGELRKGYINIVNPFRGIFVLGQPGCGKSFTWILSIIRQHIEKGFSICVYDFKFPELTDYTYTAFKHNENKYKIKPKFCVINFTDLKKSHRCNPIIGIKEATDVMEISRAFFLNINKTWVEKEGGFFEESAMIYFAAIIWALKKYKNGQYLSIPHAMMMMSNSNMYKVLDFLFAERDTKYWIVAFKQAIENKAMAQISGQINSAQIALGRLINSKLAWILSGNDFNLDVNNPKEPKILSVGNDSERSYVYGSFISLFLTRMTQIINKPNMNPTSIILDELPSIYVRGLDRLMATARSNKVAVTLLAQIYEQIERDYLPKEAAVTIGLPANIACGSCSLSTAEKIYKMFGKVKERRTSVNYDMSEDKLSESLQVGDLIPVSKIITQRSGEFCGIIARDHDTNIQQPLFSARIKIDNSYKNNYESPIIYPDLKEEDIENNFEKIEKEVESILHDLDFDDNFEEGKSEEEYKNKVKGHFEKLNNMGNYKNISAEELEQIQNDIANNIDGIEKDFKESLNEDKEIEEENHEVNCNHYNDEEDNNEIVIDDDEILKYCI